MTTPNREAVERILLEPSLTEIEIENIKSGGDININLEILIANTDRYQWLLGKKKVIESHAEVLPESTMSLKQINEKIRQFKVDLLEYAITIYRLDEKEVESVTVAREQLFTGQLAETDRLLDAASLVAVQEKHEQLLATRSSLVDVYQKLVINGEEFLVKAQLTLLNYELPERFQRAVQYFEKSLVSVRRAKGFPKRRTECFTAAAKFYQEYRHINRSIPLYGEAIDIVQLMTLKEPAVYNYVLASIRNNLAALYFSREEYDKAIEQQRLSLDYFEKAADDGNPLYWVDVVLLMGNLANSWMKKGNMLKASYYYDSCVSAYDNPLFESNDERRQIKALGLGNAALYFNKIKETDKAINAAEASVKCFRELARDRKLAMVRHLSISLTNLAMISIENGLVEQAEVYYSESLELIRRLSKQDAERIIADLTGPLINIANLWTDLGKLTEAHELYQEAMHNVQEMIKRDPETFTSSLRLLLSNYGTTLEEMGEQEKAEAAHEEAVKIARALFAKDRNIYRSDLASALNNRATCMARLGQNYPQALKDFDEALAVIKPIIKINPLEHLPTIGTLEKNAGDALKDMELFDGAYERYQKALHIWHHLKEKAPGVYLSEAANTMVGMAMVSEASNEYARAFDHYKQSADIYAYLQAEREPGYFEKMVRSYLNSANVAEKTGEAGKVIAVHTSLIKVLARINGGEYEVMARETRARSHFKIGHLERDANNIREALKHLEDALNIYKDLAMDHGRDLWAGKFCMTALFIGNTLAGCNVPKAAEPAFLDALATARTTLDESPSEKNRITLGLVAANFAEFYADSIPNEQHSLALVSEALLHVISLPEETERREAILEACFRTLRQWGKDSNAFVASVVRRIERGG